MVYILTIIFSIILSHGMLVAAFAENYPHDNNSIFPAPVPAPAPIPGPPPMPAPPLSGFDGSGGAKGLNRTRKNYLKDGVKCDALYRRPFYIYKVGNNEQDVEYNRVVSEYVDKYFNNYRPESFFTTHLKIIERTDLIKDELLRKRIKQNRLDTLSKYYHFDDSIKTSLMKLAEQHYLRSFYCLGFVYENGIGEKVDYVAAWAWFYTAYSVDGINAKPNLNRVWKHLNVHDEIKAKLLADKYVRLYTDFTSTPSVTIIK